MKYLKIDDNKGYFFRENAWVPIDQIIKEDIFELISLAVLPKDGTTFEMDEFSEEKLQHKENIQDSVNQQFASALQKYSTN